MMQLEFYLSVMLVYMILWGCCVVFLLPLKHRSRYGVRMAAATAGWLLWASVSCCIQSVYGYRAIVWIVNAGVLSVVFLYSICQERKSIILYVGIWSMLSAQVIVQLWNMILLYMNRGKYWGLLIIWSAWCIWVLRYSIARWLPGQDGYDVGPRKLALSVLISIAFEICVVSMQRDGMQELDSTRNLLLLAIQFYCITILYMQNALFQKSAMRQELETMNLLWRQQKEQYELSKENIALINRKCHDLKHQIAAIRAMGSSEERDTYIKELQKSLNIYDSAVRTGNEVLDTILTEKSLYCEANDIKIHCVVDGKQLAFMDPVDLYTILGNALDNAIESVQNIHEQEKRIIDVLVYTKQKFLVMNITNPVEGEVRFLNGMPVTTKEKNGYHGFGTKSIRHTVEKYSGYASFAVENGYFVVKMLFPVK